MWWQTHKSPLKKPPYFEIKLLPPPIFIYATEATSTPSLAKGFPSSKLLSAESDVTLGLRKRLLQGLVNRKQIQLPPISRLSKNNLFPTFWRTKKLSRINLKWKWVQFLTKQSTKKFANTASNSIGFLWFECKVNVRSWMALLDHLFNARNCPREKKIIIIIISWVC